MNITETLTEAPTPQPRAPGAPLISIVGPSATLHGTFEIADGITIECEVGGQLNVGSRLVIGRAGAVSADVRTVEAVIHGRYEGTLIATGSVEIMATGHVVGNIQTDSLVIARGGFFNGTVISQDAAAAGGTSGALYLLEDRRASAAR